MVWEGDGVRGVCGHTTTNIPMPAARLAEFCHSTTTQRHTHNMMAAVHCRCVWVCVAHTPLCWEGKEVGGCLVVYAAATLELCPKTREK